MTEQNGLLTVREELNRKTFSTVEWLCSRVETGQLSPQQFSTAIDAVWSTAAGLVDDSILEVVTTAEAIAGKDPATLRRVFHKDGRTALAQWIVGQERITLTEHGPAGKKEKTLNTDTPVQALQALDKLAVKLVQAGWEEL
jgi:hypothetical protein